MCMAVRIASPISLTILGSTWLGSSIALAHPGHAHEAVPAESPWHFLLQPEHALVSGIGLVAIFTVSLVVWSRIASVRRQQRLQPIRVRH